MPVFTTTPADSSIKFFVKASVALTGNFDTWLTGFKTEAASKGISLEASIDPELAQRYRIDAGRLMQVLANVTSNAVKFTSHGGVEIAVKLTGRGDELDNVSFTVRDTSTSPGCASPSGPWPLAALSACS